MSSSSGQPPVEEKKTEFAPPYRVLRISSALVQDSLVSVGLLADCQKRGPSDELNALSERVLLEGGLSQEIGAEVTRHLLSRPGGGGRYESHQGQIYLIYFKLLQNDLVWGVDLKNTRISILTSYLASAIPPSAGASPPLNFVLAPIMLNDWRRNDCPCADCSLVFGFRQASVPNWMKYVFDQDRRRVEISGDAYLWKVFRDISNGREDRGELHRVNTTMMSRSPVLPPPLGPPPPFGENDLAPGFVFLIPVGVIRAAGHIPEFGTCAGLVRVPIENLSDRHILLSHLWENPLDPDPHLNQFRLLVAEYKDDAQLLWIDYSCLPQKGLRTVMPALDKYFKETLRRLHHVCSKMKVCRLVPEFNLPDYYHRGWCLFESYYIDPPGVEALQFSRLTVERDIEFAMRTVKVRFTRMEDISAVELMIKSADAEQRAFIRGTSSEVQQPAEELKQL